MSRWRSALGRWLAREADIPLASCVHYTGFRYGRGEFHPYESYQVAFAQGGDLGAARARFVEFLQHYRPRHLGEALGVDLTREYAPWHFPWLAAPPAPAWLATPERCPDILTHFSAAGIPRERIAEEFRWLEEAVTSIRRHGFQPERFGAPIEVRRLVRADGAQAHLVYDGNHRIGALVALGQTSVRVRCLGRRDLREDEIARWPQVRNGTFTADDARRLLHAYFDGNRRPRTVEAGAPLLGSAP